MKPSELLNDIYCLDCLDFLSLIDDNSVDLVITDPPYLTTGESWDKVEVFTDEVVSELFRVLKETSSIYVWCGIGEKSQSLIRWFPLLSKYFHFKDLITWKKRRGIGMRKGWLYTREEIMWFVKNNDKFIWNIDSQYNENEENQFKKGFTGYECKSRFKRFSNVWTDIPEFLGNKKVAHFTPKPLEALERIIKVHTSKNDIVLDPFMGLGSTAVAAKMLDRNFIGCDISQDYVDEARKRITG